MKSNELRIGNLIEVNGQIMTVESMGQRGSMLDNRRVIFFKEDDCQVGEFLMDCKRVNLTEEWLVKFGFKNCCDLWVWYIDKFELQEMEDVDGNSTGYGYAIDGVVEDLIIRYVHQLQNLYFAITGQELQAVD